MSESEGAATEAATESATESTEAAQEQNPWNDLATELGITPDDVRKKLTFARKWEERAKANSNAATELSQLQQQFADLQAQISERDAQEAERSGKLALAQVHAGLAEIGVKRDDVKDLFEQIDPLRLLKDGQPDEAAIKKIVGSLSRVAGRTTADPDQGKSGNTATNDMNELFRRAVRGGNL